MVYEATHVYTGRTVALKVLKNNFSGNEEAKERLLREAQAVGAVRHANVVDIFDAGVDKDGQPYVALEMLEGRTLEGLLAARGRLAIGDAVCIARNVADALSACHAQGAIHRDIKPGNIFVIRTVSGDERIKLIDFGISRPGQSTERQHIKLTMADSLLGTAEYMAPEQLLNPEHIDARVDVYALGITMFEMLTGVVPFSGNLPEIVVKVTTQTAPSARTLRPDLPDPLAAILAMAVMRAPSDRFASASALSGALASTGLASARTNLLAPSRSSVGPGSVNIAAMLEEIMSRRKFSRAPYITPVRITLRDKTIDARSEDVSEGGLLVITNQPVPENETVVMQFALPATGELITCYGDVRWNRPRPENPHAPCATGIQFNGLAESALMVIRHYVSVAGYPD